MNLLELSKEIKEKKSNKQKIEKELEDYKEIKKVIYEISIGEEKHITNNKELFNAMSIKLTDVKKVSTFCYPFYHNEVFNYEFKLNETNITKIQKYIDKGKSNE